MAINAKPFFIKVITPLHAGSGSDLGVVDLPIQREAHTAFPKIEGSSLKGSIRSKMYDDKFRAKSGDIEAVEKEEILDKTEDDIKKIKEDKVKAIKNGIEKELEAIFGKSDEAGKLGFSDARILFFPVKSVKGVFAYVTCPMVLKRFCKDKELAVFEELNGGFTIPLIASLDDENCIVLGENKTVVVNDKVILEEYSFTVSKTESTEFIKIPKLDIEKERIVIISDDNFKHFVQNSTEVITRIRIGKNGVVDKENGALFTEEYLPAETIMYASAIGETEKFTNDTPTTLQIGGNSTLGKGIVELTIGVKEDGGK